MQNKKQLILMLVFYVAIGLAACFLFFIKGNLSNPFSSYEIQDDELNHTIIGTVSYKTTAEDFEEYLSENTESDDGDSDSEEVFPESDEPAEPDTEELQYFSFSTLNRSKILHVRATPSLDGEILAQLKPGTEGFVLEKGDEWTLISVGEISGYASNDYLNIHEISSADYPEELKQKQIK